ncbi:unnamed protein product [Brachionus calyciflorus]|uniref:Integrase catalytic domain-containing protein n=1 Tax=Brachionus calyciflorus TaxID=104777 RepID=A0A814F2I6_9BILA|nr:unnamed protein product [Brachionus calyciflorus]
MLKDALTSYPVLRLADVSRPFLMYTDASGYAGGAILAEIDDDGKEYVVAYASRLMTKHEINYGITEKECLAVMFSIKTFRNYLHGVKLNGVNRSNVDALSRPVESINFNIKTVVEDTIAKSLDPWEDEPLIHYLKFGRFISGTSKKQIKRITSLAQKYLYQNDKLYVLKDDHTLEISKPEERLPIEKAHVLGHFQAESTYNGLKDKFYWKRMLNDIHKYIWHGERNFSDQGRDFVNEIKAQLKNNMGFEDTITSAYNPRTNGLTERLNQTLGESLRKHCESDKENRTKHLDYVLMAYRSRVHSVIYTFRYNVW